MRLIDADELLDRVKWANTNPLTDHGETAVKLIKAMPTIEPTLYGYRLEHLAFVAAILQNKGVTEENLTDVLNCVDWIVGMVLKEAKEKTMQAFIKNEVEECQ